MKKTFKDQIPPAGGRKYRITANADGTSGIEDVTEYQQEGTPFGAKEAMQLYDGIVPPGAVMPYAGSTAPDGWLLCDGSAVSRTTYAALFAVIGTTYGTGNGSTTFSLPDLRGRVAAMRGSGQSVGDTAGAETAALKTANLPYLEHSIAVEAESQQSESVNVFKPVWTNKYNYSSNGLKLSSGKSEPFDLRQPTLYLNYIIKC